MMENFSFLRLLKAFDQLNGILTPPNQDTATPSPLSSLSTNDVMDKGLDADGDKIMSSPPARQGEDFNAIASLLMNHEQHANHVKRVRK